MRSILYILTIVLLSQQGMAQVPGNDQCLFATFIENVDHYCSDLTEFTNQNATPDLEIPNSCFLNYENGVWFSFIPREPAVLIQVNTGPRTGGTLIEPKIALFSNCGEFVECSPGKDEETDELTVNNLIIGQVYYIMIESPTDLEGTFQLCINDFVAPPSPESDCNTAVVLCDKSSFSIENLNTAGLDDQELQETCFSTGAGGGLEFASSWYTWTCDKSGTLTFTLTPNNFAENQITDDLDFVLFELPNGPKDCNGKIPLRCMASGANGDGSGNTLPLNQWAGCNGLTGLRTGDPDLEEFPGCQDGNNNFVAELDMVAGKSYGLSVNNFSRSGLGFSIEFGGTGTFQGPEPDFDLTAIQAFECDKTITFNNLSNSETDSIIGYYWNFGVGSNTPFVDGEGPHDIIYDSFGDKIASLSVETARGCVVTKVIDFYVEPCCADTSNLRVNAEAINAACGGEATGQIIGSGQAGSPQYSYSLDGINFQPNPQFIELLAGEYELFIRDIKGCLNNTSVEIGEPEVLLVHAGPDTTIDLGQTTQIIASYSPPNSNVSITWLPEDSLSCTNCLNPISKTPGTTQYIIQIQDINGCIARDTIIINVNDVRPVFAPNIFSPNEDGRNDLFNLFGGPAVSGIEELKVFDRWGNIVYTGTEITINDRNAGWDGKFGDKPLNPAVYTWIAKVRFIDGIIQVFTGDITLIQ